ncbi:Eco47II family restriction endonuclease [Chrysiogenes arsenatis]|uniref:Eco47II family restriction endonuclease n=1 Tax=Chrysiogenes arsenatis TaxID=309797 RepID=UPI001F006B09|nr:Eco47II family restriction endonuclease [Chrysiogenes arsenatis]
MLTWIPDEALIGHVKVVLEKGLDGINKAEKDFARNAIDPFSALFDAGLQNISLGQWIASEKRRQAQKTLQNALGHFHQSILSSVEHCYCPQEGFVDLANDHLKIVAEIKNKHNTVKKSDLKSVYEELDGAVNHKTSKYHGYTAYYVTVISARQQRFTKPFTPPDNRNSSRKTEQRRILEIDGMSFYELLTGQKDALYQLYRVLPNVIQTLMAEEGSCTGVNLARDPLFLDFFQQTFAQPVP